MMQGLPLLPGLLFNDVTKCNFHVPQHFNFVNGYRISRHLPTGIGGSSCDVESVAFLQDGKSLRVDPALFYGHAKQPPPGPLIPHFVLYGGKCLRFCAFFKQGVFESQEEYFRVRPVNIIYFLEDDTITVIEPPTRNAGFVQGRLVRRGRIPKSTDGALWHWKDLNVGIDVALYGKVFHIVDCDAFTREYLLSQGVLVGERERMPADPYALERRLRVQPLTTVSPSLDTKLRRFLEYGGKVLRFFAVWDDREAELGELRPFVIYYHLEDDTVEVQEVHTPNDGRDPFPLLLSRIRLPRDWRDVPVDFPSVALETTAEEVTSYYTPVDFIVGHTIFVLGRRFLLYDCDTFTRRYYEHMLHITQPCRIEVFPPPPPPTPKPVPPHIGIGTPEDAYQSVIKIVPTPPRKDVVRQLYNANKVLRYTAHLDPVHPEDMGRRFLLVFSLADGSIKVLEPPIDNSGRVGVKFLRPERIRKPGAEVDDPNFYSPCDLYIGARIVIYGHHFIVDGCDLHVYRYMQDNPDKFPPAVMENVRGWLAGQGLLADDVSARALEREREAAAAAAASCDYAGMTAAHTPCPPPPQPPPFWQVPCPPPQVRPPCDPLLTAPIAKEPFNASAVNTVHRLAVECSPKHMASQGEFPGGPP